MILQKDTYLKPRIQKYGCYLLSIFFLVNKYRGSGFDRKRINDLYSYLQMVGWMDKDCYIKYPVEIFRYLGMDVTSIRKESPDYICDPNEIEILCWERTYNKNGKSKTYSHFTCGNGTGVVTYDPSGCSNAVRYGHLKSKRIFTHDD